MDLSIVIVTHNNFSNKYGCIESVIKSLLNQKEVEAEIIIVDNNSKSYDVDKLHNINKIYKTLNVIYSNINNISHGRNLGAKSANSDTILYLDDDMILQDAFTLKKVFEDSRENHYGYSAIRLWTKENWYENNKSVFDDLVLSGDETLNEFLSFPDPQIRNKNNIRHLARTYIGNFGFIEKATLEEVGFWDESYKGYGLEDDDMALKLYLKYGRPKSLKNIKVVHISHPINKKNYNELELNKKIFEEKLKNLGIKVFHIGRLMYEEEDILEIL